MRPLDVDWESVNWKDYNDAEIARSLGGINISTVKLHRPKDIRTPGKHAWKKRHGHLIGEMPVHELAKTAGIPTYVAWHADQRHKFFAGEPTVVKMPLFADTPVLVNLDLMRKRMKDALDTEGTSASKPVKTFATMTEEEKAEMVKLYGR